MPQAQNITVKDGVGTDVTLELQTPAAGYGGLARWVKKGAVSASLFPVLTASASRSNKGDGGVVKFKFRVPSTVTPPATGIPVVANSMEMNVTISVPDEFPENEKSDAVAYLCTLWSNATVVQAMVRDATPAT